MRKGLFAYGTALVLVCLSSCREVVGPLGEGTRLTYALCSGSPDAPVWFAFQDGDGAWRRVNPSATGSFDFGIASGRGGIAAYTTTGDNPQLYVVYATTEEFQASLPACTGSVRTISGSATGYTNIDNIDFAVGTSGAVVFGSTASPAPFTLPAVDANASDLIAIRHRSTPRPTATFEVVPNNIFIRRNVTGTTTPAVDFSSTTEAGAPQERSVGVTNMLSTEDLSVDSYLGLKSTQQRIAIYEASATLASGTVTGFFQGVPGARLQSGESQMVKVFADRNVSATVHETREKSFVFVDPADNTVTLGPALGAVTVSGGSRPTASYTVQGAYDKLFQAVFSQGEGTSFRQVEVLATSAYLGGSRAVTLAVPNLSGASGFSSNWLLVPGVSSIWRFRAFDASLAAFDAKPLAYQAASRSSIFIP